MKRNFLEFPSSFDLLQVGRSTNQYIFRSLSTQNIHLLEYKKKKS